MMLAVWSPHSTFKEHEGVGIKDFSDTHNAIIDTSEIEEVMTFASRGDEPGGVGGVA